MEEHLRIIVSGGGTGGHIFPAISIANAIKELHPEAEILFIGAEGRMEMQRVPAAGYKIIGLPVAGFDRKHLLKTSVYSSNCSEVSGWPENHKRLQTSCCRRCRRLCQRTDAKSGRHDGHSDTDTRTEFLRRCHQQIAGPESRENMCGIRRHGALL